MKNSNSKVNSSVLFAVPAVAVGEAARSAGRASMRAGGRRFVIHTLSASLLLAIATAAHAEPAGGVVTNGAANISTTGVNTTITQTTSNVAINWQSFSIASGETVQFVQPDSNSVALNRVIGSDPSVIHGSLNANGKVFLLNPNGVLFGDGATVNVGGLIASTMSITDADFTAGNHVFTDAGSGAIVNRGSITAADSGFVALMGRSVSNQGVITARLGTVALSAGEAVTLDVAGDGLLNVSITQGAVDALVENGGLIQADGGRVLLTARAAGDLLNTVVNNTGVIQAHTIVDRNGTIRLLGDLQSGTVNVGGTLDAGAPAGGVGGSVETSAATVNIDAAAQVTTAAADGSSGEWLIGAQDFTVGSAPGDNIAGSTLSAKLVTNNITIQAGAGDGVGSIVVNDAISWTASGDPTTLNLLADGNAEINAAITSTNGNLMVCVDQDVNVNAALTATNGSILLAALRDVNQRADITVTDGNLMMCAAEDVNIFAAITLTRGTNDPTRSLALPRGLTLSADTDGTGPGIEGGTVNFDSLAPPATVTAAPVNIFYNPVSYTTPTDYSGKFTLTEGAALQQFMLVFADGGDKTFDGTTTTTLSGLQGNPAGVTLVAGPDATANFDSPDVGTDQGITFTGYTLGGTDAGLYALPLNCCGPVAAHTTGTITAAVTPPPVTPPPVTPPPVTPPPVTPPPVVAPILPPVGEPLLGILPPRPVFVPPPEVLVSVTPESQPPMTLTVIQPPLPEEVPPYVPPVRKPKPYRN